LPKKKIVTITYFFLQSISPLNIVIIHPIKQNIKPINKDSKYIAIGISTKQAHTINIAWMSHQIKPNKKPIISFLSRFFNLSYI